MYKYNNNICICILYYNILPSSKGKSFPMTILLKLSSY